MRWAGVRFMDGEFALRCEGCAAKHQVGGRYWPMTTEFWDPHRGMTRCRACWREKDARIHRQYRTNHLERVREIQRRYSREVKDVANRKAQWKRAAT